MRYFNTQKLLIAAAAISLATVSAFAQKGDPKETPTTDVNTKVRNVKPELKEAYKNWINKDVTYIITKEEKRAFMALATDEERENFIENFWRRRDPNPDTEENEYREEYYERIAYANEHFTSGIPGWKTDRGRVYISWGKPDSIESHPTGGAYDRPSYEGGGSTTTYPFEIWFYRHLDNVGDGLEIEFVDPTGTGEYRMARNANEKDALLMVPGAGLTTNETLGLSDKSDRISGLSNNNNYMREQDSPFRRMEIQNGLFTPPAVKFGDLTTGVESGVLDTDPVDFDVRVDFFRQSDTQVIAAFTIQTPNRELNFKDNGGLQTARLNILGRITAVSGKRSGLFEDSVTAQAAPGELTEVQDRKSVYQKLIALPPGTYKVDVVVRDVESGNKGIRNLGFQVPRYDDKKLSTSSMILATKLRSTNDRDIGGMFVIGNAKVLPNLSGEYRRGEDVGVYMQVYNAGIDQTTLRPAVDVTYILTRGGKTLISTKEDWSGLSDSGQRLTLARIIPTSSLEIGDYTITIEVKDSVSGQIIKNESKFSIKQ